MGRKLRKKKKKVLLEPEARSKDKNPCKHLLDRYTWTL